MLLQESYTELGVRCGLSSSTADKARMLSAMKESLKEMFRRCKFIALRDTGTITTVASTYLYYLDTRVLFIQEMTSLGATAADGQGNLIQVWNQTKFNKTYPDIDTTDTDEPTIMVPTKQFWVTTQPTAASTISVVSSSASDVTTYFVVVRGISGGIEKRERLTLTGVTPVVSSNSYTSLISITKDATIGAITATSNSGVVTNISLLPAETEKSNWQVRLHKVPDDVYTINYPFFVKPWAFSYDEDLIPIEDRFDDLLMDFAESALLRKQSDPKWTSTHQLLVDKLDEVVKDDYFSEDTDARMTFIELDEDYEGW